MGEALGPSPSPWGTPISARLGTDFRDYFFIGRVTKNHHTIVQRLSLMGNTFAYGGVGASKNGGEGANFCE